MIIKYRVVFYGINKDVPCNIYYLAVATIPFHFFRSTKRSPFIYTSMGCEVQK